MTWWQILLMVIGGIIVTVLLLIVAGVVLVNFMIWLDLRLHHEGPSLFKRHYEAAVARRAQRARGSDQR